jgi:hypothetical protein
MTCRTWRRVFGVVILAVAVTGALAAWAGVEMAGGGTPRLALDRTEIDFGDVVFGRRVRASFTLTNTGRGPLVIEGVSPVRAIEGC